MAVAPLQKENLLSKTGQVTAVDSGFVSRIIMAKARDEGRKRNPDSPSVCSKQKLVRTGELKHCLKRLLAGL
jgi:hypothetical protein